MLEGLFWVAFFLFLAGFGLRIRFWFTGSFRGKGRIGARLKTGLWGMGKTLASRRVLVVIKALLIDGVFQLRTLREDRYRWAMHLLIYWGFGLLLVTHAFGRAVFGEYISTAMPHAFLRDLFGAMVLGGTAMAVVRRWVKGIPRFVSSPMDLYAVVMVALIVLSGFLLKGAKITSHKAYLRMVEEYGALGSEEEARALEAYWVSKMGLVSPGVSVEDEALVAQGAELHAFSCAPCHANPRVAFLSYGISRALKPLAPALDRVDFPKGLWWVHILPVFVGLALLPFTKFLHLLTVPLSLVLGAVVDPRSSSKENLETKRMVELDACVHCGTCTVRCAVGPAIMAIPNRAILPSEKIAPLKALASGRSLTSADLALLLEGVYLCTNCLRCTVSCPAGIDLQGLWVEAREALFERGVLEPAVLTPLSFYRGLRGDGMGYGMPLEGVKGRALGLMKPPEGVLEGEGASPVPLAEATFMACFSCETCTNSCPVVFQYERPGEALGLLPHQIMRLCALGMEGAALGAPMLWRCLTCYKCQEYCPQGVKVADILIGLKGAMIKALKGEGYEVRPVFGM